MVAIVNEFLTFGGYPSESYTNNQLEVFMDSTQKQVAYAKFFETHIDSGVTEGLFKFVDASAISNITNPNSVATLVENGTLPQLLAKTINANFDEIKDS